MKSEFHNLSPLEMETASGRFGEYLENPMDAKERMVVIARNMAIMRKEAGMSQKDVCEVIGCAPQTYSGYEKGKHEPTIETLVRLSHLYGVSVDFLVGRNEDTPEGVLEEINGIEGNPILEDLQRRMIELELRLEEMNKKQ